MSDSEHLHRLRLIAQQAEDEDLSPGAYMRAFFSESERFGLLTAESRYIVVG